MLIESVYNLVMANYLKNIDNPFSEDELKKKSIEVNKVSGTNDDSWNMSLKTLKQRSGGELTISSGVVTITSSLHNIDTEASAATDDLDTINGGMDGQRLVISANSSTRTVIVKDLTGNLQINSDFSMTNQADRLELIYDEATSFWYEVARSNNAA